MKTDTILIIAAVVGGAYFLTKNQSQTEDPSTPSSAYSLGESGLSGILSGIMSAISGMSLGGVVSSAPVSIPDLSEITGQFKKILENQQTGFETNIGGLLSGFLNPEQGYQKTITTLQDQIQKLLTVGKGAIPGLPEKTTPLNMIPNLKSGNSILDSLLPNADTSGLREKAGEIMGVGTGVVGAYATKGLAFAGSKVLSTLFTHLAPALAGRAGMKLALGAIPYVGWAYLGADIGATTYELISGKNIAGSWLGWGELINPQEGDWNKWGGLIPGEANRQLALAEAFSGIPERSVIQRGETTPYNTNYVSDFSRTGQPKDPPWWQKLMPALGLVVPKKSSGGSGGQSSGGTSPAASVPATSVPKWAPGGSGLEWWE